MTTISTFTTVVLAEDDRMKHTWWHPGSIERSFDAVFLRLYYRGWMESERRWSREGGIEGTTKRHEALTRANVNRRLLPNTTRVSRATKRTGNLGRLVVRPSFSHPDISRQCNSVFVSPRIRLRRILPSCSLQSREFPLSPNTVGLLEYVQETNKKKIYIYILIVRTHLRWYKKKKK